MRNKRALILMLIIIGLFLASGCQTAKKPTTPQTSPTQVTESDKRVMANRFSTIAQQVEGVSKATVVVASAEATTTGETTASAAAKTGGKMVVMVGLTLDAKTSASSAKQKTVMNTVKQKILANDKRITDVLVTADPNMVKKINDVAAGLIEGKPVLSYAKSAAELGKMMKNQTK